MDEVTSLQQRKWKRMARAKAGDTGMNEKVHTTGKLMLKDEAVKITAELARFLPEAHEILLPPNAVDCSNYICIPPVFVS
ncbi:hypothetical protein ACOSQ4_022362 [Xanthoceras sorbifolium]